MRSALAALLTLTLAAAGFAGSPAGAVAAALADAQRLPPAEACQTRYLSLYNLPDAADRDELYRVVTQHLWAVSREADPPRPRWVGADLLAVRLDGYGIDRYAYGRLVYRDPYFHVRLTYDGSKADGAVPSPAPWLGDPAAVAKLYRLTDSVVPVLRADWWYVETAIQEGRGEPGKGTGYYDLLGVKSRQDYFDFVGYDPKLAAKRKSVFANAVQRRGPGVFPGQVFREGAVDGAVWQTRDVSDLVKEERDAVRQLGKNFKHQLEEWYGFGPAGLWATALTDEKGNLQARAPAAVLTDDTKVGPDKNIDTNLSCLRCHNTRGEGGLQPVKSYHHANVGALGGTLELGDPEEGRLYVRELNTFLKRDGDRYAERLKECCDYTPRQLGQAVIRVWDRYVETDRTLDDCAREYGTTPERFGAALKAVAAQKKLDPVFAPLLVGGGIRHEHFEKVFPVGFAYLGYRP